MRINPVIKYMVWILPLCISLLSCNSKTSDSTTGYQPEFSPDTSGQNTVIFAFPYFSFGEKAEPLIKYLNKHLKGAQLKSKCYADPSDYFDDLAKVKFDLTLVNGLYAIQAEKGGYSIKVKIAGGYSGVIVTRKEAKIKQVTDLKGKKIAFSSYKMFPSCMMPLYYLYQNGLDVNHDIIPVNVPTADASLVAAYSGESDAGFCLKRNWELNTKEHPEFLSRLELKWTTPPLPDLALIVKNTTDQKITVQISGLLLSLHKTEEGRAALKSLGIDGFEKANTETYKPMRDFKAKYDSIIHL